MLLLESSLTVFACHHRGAEPAAARLAELAGRARLGWPRAELQLAIQLP